MNESDLSPAAAPPASLTLGHAPRLARLRPGFGLVSVLLAGVALRAFATQNELWLDEIWSLEMTRAVASPLELLTRGHHDNNHLLNTWYLFAVGAEASPLCQRLLALLSGVAGVGAAAWIARRDGRLEAGLAATLCALSFPLVLYSSEARGYAPAALCALLAFALQRRALRAPRTSMRVLFWLACALGFLAHTSFLHVYLALLAWSAQASFASGGWRALTRELLCAHGVPVAFLAALYGITLRHMLVGGGPILAPFEVARETLARLGGVPLAGVGGTLVALGVAAALGVGLVLTFRRERGEGFFFLTALTLAPALVVLLTRPEILYFRYFLVCVPFAYLLLARALAAWARRGRLGWLGVALALAAFLAGQTMQLGPLFRDGRGRYGETVAYMAAASDEPVVEVGSDHDFRNRMVLEFHARRLGLAERMRYVPEGRWPTRGPEWLLLHSQDLDERPQAEIVHLGRRYQLAHVARFGGVSGWHWFLYRRPPLR